MPVQVASYTIKYEGNLSTIGGTVDSSAVSVRINGEITTSIGVSIDRATDSRDYAIIHLSVLEQLSYGQVIAISVNNSTGQLYNMGSSVSIQIFVGGYSEGSIDLGNNTGEISIDATSCASGTHYIAIRGISAIPTDMTCSGITFDIPEAISTRNTVSGGFLYVGVITDNSVLTNGPHEVSITLNGVQQLFTINVVNGITPIVSHDSDYSVNIQLNQDLSDTANVVLDVELCKNTENVSLEDMRLLIVAKYSGDYYVFNFYSKPVMEGINGIDRVVLSRANLSCVIIEVVDGIQTLDVTFYGIGTYVI